MIHCDPDMLQLRAENHSSKLDSNTRFSGTDYKCVIEIKKREKSVGSRLGYRWTSWEQKMGTAP